MRWQYLTWHLISTCYLSHCHQNWHFMFCSCITANENITIWISLGVRLVIGGCISVPWFYSKMFPHLSGFRVNIALFQEAASKELFSILEKCEGTKVIWTEHQFSVRPIRQRESGCCSLSFFIRLKCLHLGNCLGRLIVRPRRFGHQIHIAQGTECNENVAIACRTIARRRCTQHHFYHAANAETDGLCGRECAQHRKTTQDRP